MFCCIKKDPNRNGCGPGLTWCVKWLAVGAGVCWVGEFAVSSDVGSAVLAHVASVFGDVGVCGSGWFECYVGFAAVGASEFVARPHAQMRVVAHVGAEPVIQGG